jgi:cytochrome c oxidase accessory protein FixG
VCLIVCPYGRLQGVMTDRNSILVAYDYLRGEPRSKYKKEEKKSAGDCIDCEQCVKVCPVGIDIRNGSQLECTSCTACIDACNFMMEKVGSPKGLIRYDSENGIAKKEKLRITSRMIAYSSVLLALIAFLVILLSTRSDVDATILRTPGMLFQKQPHNMISNLYNIKLINKTRKDMPISLRLESEFGYVILVGKNVIVPGESKAENEFFIYVPRDQLKERKTKFKVGIYSGNKKIQTIKTSFLGPVNINK